MVDIKDLSMEFGNRTLFCDVTFSINPGERIGLIGRNGAGKSTFFKLLLKELEPSDGEIRIPDYYTIGHLSQHFHFTHATVTEEVCSVLTGDREDEAWKGDMILMGLGFSYEQMDQNPNSLSGGFQVKVNLAKMLLLESNLLLLDEPTNYLDIYSIRWLSEFLRKWEGELILVTHDRAFLESVITHTLIIHRGNFRKVPGKPAKIKEQISQEEEIFEKHRIAAEKERKETEEWIRRFGAKASMASRAKSVQRRLDRESVMSKLAAVPVLDFKFASAPYDTKLKPIEIENLTFGYYPDKIIINDFSFRMEKGDKICIIGKNGNGKSTLLQLMAGFLKPNSGSVVPNEKVISGYFGQTNVERLNPKNKIWEEVQEANPSADYATVRRICAYMMFAGELGDKRISVLSGGEKSRVLLGKILLSNVNMLFLDEPTNHFDIESADALMDAIKEFDGSLVMVTHDERFLHEIANKLIVFDGGKIFAFHGTYEKFLREVGWKE